MNESEWLQNLKVGDAVFISGSGGMGSADCVSSVKRLTKTLIITEGGSRFRRDNGWSQNSGGGYYRRYLQEPTQQKLDDIRKVLLAAQFKRIKWETLSLKTLEAVKKLLLLRIGGCQELFCFSCLFLSFPIWASPYT